MGGLLAGVLWWGGVIGAYFMADYKRRNRLGWTVAAVFVPVVAFLVVSVLPRKVRLVDGYHPDYKRLGT